MKKSPKLKIKRALGGVITATVMGGSLVPVVACNTEDFPDFNVDNLDKDIAAINKQKKSVKAATDGISNLPSAPANTHWEYSLNGDDFSSAPPETMTPNAQLVIKLVSDNEAIILPDDVEITRTVLERIDVDTILKNSLKNIVITTDRMIVNPPDVPNTHLEYSRDGGINYQTTLPDNLQRGSELTIQLRANDGYELAAKDLVRTIYVVEEILVSEELLETFATTTAVAGAGFVNLLAAPEHTHWEYALHAGENYGTIAPAKTALIAGFPVGVRLAGDNNYYLSKPVSKTVIPVAPLSVDELTAKFATTRVDVNKGLINLPPVPTGYEYRYARNANNKTVFWNIFPSRLEVGDVVSFKLHSLDYPDQTNDFFYNITVTEEINVRWLQEQLAKVSASNNRGIENLPDAPDKTHWEFRRNDGAYSGVKPSPEEISKTSKLGIRLVPDENYLLSTPVEKLEVPITRFAYATNELYENLKLASITLNAKKVTNLPTAPANSHWEFEIQSEKGEALRYQEFSPVELFQKGLLQRGQDVRILLVANSGFVLDHPGLELAVKAGPAVVNIDSVRPDGRTTKQHLQDELNASLGFNYDTQSISGVPSAPEGMHWQYRLDRNNFSDEPPEIGPEFYTGQRALELTLRLVANPNYQIKGWFSWMIVANGIVKADGFQTKLDAAIEHDDSFPETPAHAVLLDSADTSPAWSVQDPNHPDYPYVYTLEPEAGWVLSEKAVHGHD